MGRTHWRLRVRVPSLPQEREQGLHGPQGPKPPAALEQAPMEQDSFPCAQELGRGCEDEGPAARTPGERGAGRHISPQGRGDRARLGRGMEEGVQGRPGPLDTSSHPLTLKSQPQIPYTLIIPLKFPPPQISHTLTSCDSLYGGSDPSPTHRQAQEADRFLPEQTGEPLGQHWQLLTPAATRR